MSSGAIKAGQGFMELFLKSDKLDNALKSKAKQLGKWSLGLGGLGASLGAGSAAILTPLLLMAKNAANSGDALKNMSIRSGIAVESLSELEYVVGKTGGTLEDVEKATLKMNRNLAKKDAAINLASIGLSLKDLSGLTADKKLETIFDAISKVTDPAKRASVAFKIFGGAGVTLQTAFAGGAASVRALRQELIDLGGQVTTEEANAADEYGAAWMRLTTSFESVKYAIGSRLVPVLTDAMDAALNVIKPVAALIRDNKELAVTVFYAAAAGSVLATIFTGLGVAGLLLAGVMAGVGAISAAWAATMAALSGAFAFLLTPIGMVTAAVAVAVAAMVGAVFAFTNAGETIKKSLGGVFSALAGGNWALAGDILMKSLELTMAEGINRIMAMWMNFKTSFINMFAEIADQVRVEWIAVKGLIGRDLDGAAKAIKGVRDARKKAADKANIGNLIGDLAVAGLRSELDALIAKAKASKKTGKKPFIDNDAYPLNPKLMKTLVSGASVGTFSGFAAMRLGQASPGVNERIANASEETNEKLEELIEAVKAGGAEFGI